MAIVVNHPFEQTFSPGKPGAAYTVSASNVGDLATSGEVTVTDTLPTALTATEIGGQTVTPDYAGGAPGEIAGLMQINVRIPANLAPGTAVPVTVQVPDYARSQPGVTIAVGN